MKPNRFLGIVLITIFIVTYLCSCEDDNGLTCNESFVTVYKFHEGKDYSDYVPVLLDTSRTRIIGYPGYLDVKNLHEGIYNEYQNYYLSKLYNKYTGFVNLTIDEYSSGEDTITDLEFDELLMDVNPFKEFYVDENRYLSVKDDSITMHISHLAYDTLLFHQLVDSNTLGLYLRQEI